ncbi:MAG: hypothetical protein J6P81_01365 [Spirochaetales bacterium]|nr:hypothetical protein [Spirochaetales bacterium]MBO6048183.1 hypothetical protein [Spirochaetales bacterium]MBO7348440.1 hypothetical protein [Spirochaetales bacterium]MBP5756372.1 hypothetical protein [Spirochaetales bacterium]
MRRIRAERTVIILTIVFINICLLIPVWQSASNTQLRWQLAQSEQMLKAQEERKMVLTAAIAKQMTPEYLIEQSSVRNIVFTQIDSTTASLVASNR